jgi:uncharacterized protein
MQLGDARSGKLADNITAFGRVLRRAGVPTDASRMALAQEAALLVGLGNKLDLGAALEAVMVNREQDRLVFRELFDAYFRNPDITNKLLSQLLPSAEGKAEPSKRRPRVREALAAQKTYGQEKPLAPNQEVQFDAAMTASDAQRLKHADFNALGAAEFALVERLARDVALPIPCVASRRLGPSTRGSRVHWARMLRRSARTGGQWLELAHLASVQQPLPLLLLVDVSGSMERYARLLLSFLHCATRQINGRRPRRDVFAFGTELTDLSPAFRLADTDAMLAAASTAIEDFAGGTRLGHSLATLQAQHARRLVGRRTLVLIISDGLDTGEPQALAQSLDWLRRHSRRLLWLNPLLRFDGYQPLARGAAALHQKVHGHLAVHNLSKLEELAASLADIMKR